jgi:4-hydroxythreonine-4-phosphate dehydrogenase
MPSTKLPIIGITLGDAAGIGPEVVLKAFGDASLYEVCRPLAIGDASILHRDLALSGGSPEIHICGRPADARYEPGAIDCLDIGLLKACVPYGEVSSAAGHAAFVYLHTGIALALAGEVDALCTAPLNKEALLKGGHDYPGHTEILAERTGSPDYGMLFLSPTLRVILVTIHQGLLEAVRSLTSDRILRTIRIGAAALNRFAAAAPRIAVCGLNPHAGECGLFGDGEEQALVAPAVEGARGEGIDATGPFPADTVFARAAGGEFDLVVALTHDQGLGPIKTLHPRETVNVTVGLPFVRTSVDHGTAFDIAGRGVADAANMQHAIRQAALLSRLD